MRARWTTCGLSLLAIVSCSDDAMGPAGAAEDAAGASAAGAGAAGNGAAGTGGAGGGSAGAGSGASAGAPGADAGRGGSMAGGSGSPIEDAGGVALGGDAGAAPDGGSGAPACSACVEYSMPALYASVTAEGLAELSGAALSVRNPGVLFAHQDHDRTDVFALDASGALITRISLPGASAVDVEDMAVGPCPSGTCIYLADIGDNASVRSELAILRYPEPEITADTPPLLSLEAERFAFRYEDGSHNAEGLLLPPSGELYVVTKLPAGQPSSVYALPSPLSSTQVNVALEVADLPVPAAGGEPVCGASAHPCGLGFVLRAYDAVYEFRIEAGAAFESAFAVMPVRITGGDEPQSEAISYFPDGSGFVTSGEGMNAPIFATRCP